MDKSQIHPPLLSASLHNYRQNTTSLAQLVMVLRKKLSTRFGLHKFKEAVHSWLAT
ncbi:hypothetical protein J6590_036515 [Homalodisca vitripennis]|nr:hypothetical protein J6590_036515 [Homalodisca vitripennis]